MLSSNDEIVLSLWASLLSSRAEFGLVHLSLCLLLRNVNVLIHTVSTKVLSSSVWDWTNELRVDANVASVRSWAWESWQTSSLSICSIELTFSLFVLLS